MPIGDLNLNPLPTTSAASEFTFFRFILGRGKEGKSPSSTLNSTSTSISPSTSSHGGDSRGLPPAIPSSHELVLLQQELQRLNQSCKIRTLAISKNSVLLEEWCRTNPLPVPAPQESGNLGATAAADNTIDDESKLQKKIKFNPVFKLDDVQQLQLDDSMDIDQPGSVAASSADEMNDTGLRAIIKNGNGGQVSISNGGRIKMSTTATPPPVQGKQGQSSSTMKASKKGDTKNKAKNSRFKKRSHTDRDISVTISGSASINSRMTPDIPEATAAASVPGEGDYSHVKGLPPNQIPIATFWTFMERYFRNLVPEDLQALASKGDEITPFMIPPVGKHYHSQWKEEDQRLLSLFNDGVTNPALATNKEYAEVEDCVFEGDIHIGVLSDRILAAFIREGLVPDQLNDEDESQKPANRLVPRIRSKTDLSLFEERLRQELVHLGLIEEEECGGREDNDIIKMLKSTQDQLRVQIEANYVKKRKILEIAEEFMAYQEYNTLLDDINKTVDTAYTKRFKSTAKPKSKKEKSKFPATSSSFNRGFSNETIMQILESRRRLMEEVGSKFFARERFQPPLTINQDLK